MAGVLLFHHAQGLTDGVRAFADDLRAGGHDVHVPDLYDGNTFATLAEGIDYAKKVGFGAVFEQGRLAADGLPDELVYIGLSLGVMPAQSLAQTRPGAKGAVLISAAVPASEFGGAWPSGVSLQVHMMDADPIVVDEGDLDAARGLVEGIEGAELFVYPGNGHLFVDRSLPDHDEGAAARATERVLGFLDANG
jgi:dienelactone hydrolase